MNHETVCYEKALFKQFRCTGSTRKHLLQQFRGSLEVYLEDHPSPTEVDLREAFGPPEEMAGVLMESVSKAEVAQFEKQKKWKRIAAGILAALLFALTTYVFFWKEKPIISDDSMIVGPAMISPREGMK